MGRLFCNKSNKNYGVYTNYASPNILNNSITNSGSYAVYAYYYSHPKIIGNSITNNSYGLHVFRSSSPTIKNNTISNNDNHGIYIGGTYGSPLIENNTITDNGNYGIYNEGDYHNPVIKNNIIANHSSGGIYFRTSNSYPSISKNLIENNSAYGIYLQTSGKLDNNTIINHSYGVRLDGRGSKIDDGAVINSTSYDYYLYSGASLISTNTTFNKSKVYLYGSGELLDVYWHETVHVVKDFTPIENASVEVFDKDLNIVSTGSTDNNGSITFKIREYTQKPGIKIDANPHKIRAIKSGYPNGSIETNITESKTDTVTLGEEIIIPGASITIFGDLIINDTQSFSNKHLIIDNGNVIINPNGSLSLDNTKLQLRYTTDSGYKIEIKDKGSLFLSDSNVTSFYPELGYYYYFNNYGYLNIENSSVQNAYSINFYDSSDDNSTISNSTIRDNRDYGVYTIYASPKIIL